MQATSRIGRLVAAIEYSLLLTFLLVLYQGLFYPWELYLHPNEEEFSTVAAMPESSILTRTIYLILIGILIPMCLLRWKSVMKNFLVAWPFLLLGTWMLLSATWAPMPKIAFSTAVRFVLMAAYCAYICGRFDTTEFVAFLTRGFAISIFATLAVIAVNPKLVLSGMSGAYSSAWRGAFTDKNWLGAAMANGIFVCGYSYIIRANSRLLSGLSLLGCVFLLVMSHSASSIASTCIATMVLIVGGAIQSRNGVLRAAGLLAIAGVVAVVIVWPLLGITIGDINQVVGRSKDFTGRTRIWPAVWAAIKHHPFRGYGYGFWEQVNVTRDNIRLSAGWQVAHAHNNWLEAALQLGFVGVMLSALAWLIPILRSARLVLAKYGHGALFFLVIIFGCLVRTIAETTTFAPVLVSLFWSMTGYIYVVRTAQERKKQDQSWQPKPFTYGLREIAVPQDGFPQTQVSQA